MIRINRLVVLVWLGVFAACAAPTGAEGSKAVSLFQQGKYRESLPLFDQIVRNSPNDVNALHYYALALQRSGRIDEAKRKFNEILVNFPNSDAAREAYQVLYPPRLPTPMPASSPYVGTQRAGVIQRRRPEDPPPDYSSLPSEAKVYFKRKGNALMVDAQVNNHPITMVFDTGAEVCAFGKNHLNELGIPLPTCKPTGRASGVGDGGVIGTWQVRADVKLGPIVRKNMSITVQENLPGEPLLGQTFFKDFRYTIDNGANSIHFVIKQPSSASTVASKGYSPSAATLDRYAVPFTLEGNEMIVTAEVNGKPIQMIFDTGASSTVFTMQHVKQLGLIIPEGEVEHERHVGIAGETSGIGFPVERMRLGPIEKINFKISVTRGMSGHPLLGQTFYGDWQYSIDNANKLIHFLRR